MDKEAMRKAFEAWMRDKHPSHSLHVRRVVDSIYRVPAGAEVEYMSAGAQHKWLGWQAAIAHSCAWQPIETAPKDRHILAVVDGGVRVVRYGKTSHVPMYGFCLADQGVEDFDLCKPTHWMPLSPPPEGV